jgi:serine/threonine protein kinase
LSTMDSQKASKLERTLKGNQFKEYKIEKLINHGKSAAVFVAISETGECYALKIFDNELINAQGSEIQLKRISQEIELKNHAVTGLIKIIDGGKENFGDEDFYFVLMEFVDGWNLKEFISTSTYGEDFIIKSLKALYEITEELLKMGIVHRDIKPENIMISKKGDIILMDLGVIKRIGSPLLTDIVEPRFLGTLQYSPPEYLFRNENDDQAGWKAVNFYQIGAVLHELILKKAIFCDKTPYANLVLAIKEDAPHIQSQGYSFELEQLVRDLLIKNPGERLKVCTDQRIRDTIAGINKPLDYLEASITAINHLSSKYVEKINTIRDISRSIAEKDKRRRDLLDELRKAIIASFSAVMKMLRIQQYLTYPALGLPLGGVNSRMENMALLFKISKSLANGLPGALFMLFKFGVDETGIAEISLFGAFLAAYQEAESQTDTYRTLQQMIPNARLNQSLTPIEIQDKLFPKLQKVFTGSFTEAGNITPLLNRFIAETLKIAIRNSMPEVEKELSQLEARAKGESIGTGFIRVGTGAIIFGPIN